jgi:hypothetical protein
MGSWNGFLEWVQAVSAVTRGQVIAIDGKKYDVLMKRAATTSPVYQEMLNNYSGRFGHIGH